MKEEKNTSFFLIPCSLTRSTFPWIKRLKPLLSNDKAIYLQETGSVMQIRCISFSLHVSSLLKGKVKGDFLWQDKRRR